MTIIVHDTFTNTAGTSILAHTGELGATYVKWGGATNLNTPVINPTGTELKSNAETNTIISYLASGSTGLNSIPQPWIRYSVQCGGAVIGCVSRGQSASDTGYDFRWRYNFGSPIFELYRHVSGTNTLLTSLNIDLAAGEDYQPSMEVSGTGSSVSISCYIQRKSDLNYLTSAGAWQVTKVALISYSDSDATRIVTSGQAGFQFGLSVADTNLTLDSFDVDDGVAVPVISTPTQTLTAVNRTTSGATIDSGGTSGTLYALARTGGSAASAATIKTSGQSNATTGTGAKTVPNTVLTAGTANQYVDLVYNDTTNGDSNVVTVGPITTASALSFSGTVPVQNVTSGNAVDIDLSSYYSGTGFGTLSYSSVGTSLTGSGLSLNTTTGHITGTAGSAQTITGVQIRKTDSGSPASTADTNTFNIVIAAADLTNPTLTGSISVSSLTNTSYTLTWPAGSDNVAVTGYEYSLNGGSTYASVGVALTVSITGRTAGTTDQVRVRAFDGAGNRSSALAASVTLPLSVVTTPPLENSDGSLHLGATVYYSWYPTGRIGSFGSITPQEGTGVTNAVDGTLVIGTLTAGTGVLMTCVRGAGATTDSVHYHYIAVT